MHTLQGASERLLTELAELAAEIVLERLGDVRAVSPYLSVSEAADYLRCDRQRIYDLCSSRRLSKLKDGSRVLLRRDELDALIGVASVLPPASQSGMTSGVAA
jgi:excisionase family DNA binding protein